MNIKVLAWENFEQRILLALFAIMVMLVGSYLYLVNVSVFNIMARKDAEERINQLATEVAHLEAEYIGLSSQIDLATAYALGFKDASQEGTFAKTAANLSYRTR